MNSIFFSYVLPLVHVMACLFLIVVVLLQTGKGADMGAVLGGGSQTLFGASGAGNLLTKLTTGMAITFMATSLLIVVGQQRRTSSSLLDRIPQAPAPAAVPEVPPPAAPSPEAAAPPLAPSAAANAPAPTAAATQPSPAPGDAAHPQDPRLQPSVVVTHVTPAAKPADAAPVAPSAPPAPPAAPAAPAAPAP